MKNFRTQLGLAALVMLPMTAQAELKAMSLSELAAVEAQGRYSISAGSMSLFTFDTAVLAATPASGAYQLVNARAPNLVPTVRDRGLTAVNDVVLPTVNMAIRTTLISSIPVFGSTVADMFTPIAVTFTP